MRRGHSRAAGGAAAGFGFLLRLNQQQQFFSHQCAPNGQAVDDRPQHAEGGQARHRQRQTEERVAQRLGNTAGQVAGVCTAARGFCMP